MDPYFLSFEEAALAGARLAGGKGWNLGRLHRYGFRAPAGGVLVSTVYRNLLETPALGWLLRQIEPISAREADGLEAAARLQALRQAIEAARLPGEVETALARALADGDLLHRPLAVRSSATGEDGATASFAGIHRSFLNVTGPEAVVAAVKGCYASLWTPRALAYRRRLGLADSQVDCAVVICEMVGGSNGPAAAGVAFSCEPRTGRRDLITIAAVRGPGRALVEGEINPEEITVQHANFNLRVSEWRPHGPRVLSEPQALELARLAQRVQWALGDGQEPQDLEWAFDGRRFWLLQARPVTRLSHCTMAGIADLPIIWSNCNLKENFPGVLSTRTWSGGDYFLRHVLLVAFQAAGRDISPGMELTRRFSGRAYLNLTLLQWAFYDTLGVLPAEFNQALGGSQPEIPIPPPGVKDVLRRGWHMLRFFAALWRNDRSLPRSMREVKAEAQQLYNCDLSALSHAELQSFLAPLVRWSDGLGLSFNLGNSSASLWLRWLRQAARHFWGEEEGVRVASGLLAGQGQVPSAEQGYGVYDLARAAAGDAAARDYLASPPLDPQGWRRLPLNSPFRNALESYLDEYGHRGVYEAELANPPWREDPSFILDQVRLLLENGSAAEPRLAAEAVRAEAERRLSSLRWPARWLLHRLAAKARAASAMREASKGVLLLVHDNFRRAVLEAGRRLAAAGLLEQAADAFDLAVVDLESYLRGEWDGRGAAALVEDRQAQRQHWLQECPPDVIICSADGQPAELPVSWPNRPTAEGPLSAGAADGQILQGISASGGKAGGVARIIRHPGEGLRLNRGEILVAPSTDPGWSPLFLRAAAVVMEVGGYLSHGAIVAREYGLPAVVNIPGLLSRIQDGQRLVVDGDKGWVICE